MYSSKEAETFYIAVKNTTIYELARRYSKSLWKGLTYK